MALRWAIACRLALAPGGWQISAVAGCDVRSVTVRPILADEVGRFSALAGCSSLARASADRAGAALRRGPGRRVGRAGRVRVRSAVVRSPGPLPRVQPGDAVRAAAPCVNNQRFCVLPAGGRPNLASAVLSRVLRRLAGDYLAVYGHRVLAVETFTDPARHTGACYAAANFVLLGETLGYARSAGR